MTGSSEAKNPLHRSTKPSKAWKKYAVPHKDSSPLVVALRRWKCVTQTLFHFHRWTLSQYFRTLSTLLFYCQPSCLLFSLGEWVHAHCLSLDADDTEYVCSKSVTVTIICWYLTNQVIYLIWVHGPSNYFREIIMKQSRYILMKTWFTSSMSHHFPSFDRVYMYTGNTTCKSLREKGTAKYHNKEHNQLLPVTSY